MKKRKLKKWVKNLITMVIVYLIGVSFILILCERVEQINNNQQYNQVESQHE